MKRIDVHAHYFGGAVAELIAARRPKNGPGSQPWRADTALDLMDRHGVATQLLSLPFTMTSHDHDLGSAAKFARRVNEEYATLTDQHPGRFGAFAALPGNSADAMLTEIEYALDTLHLDGVGLTSNIAGHYLGSPLLEPVLTELARRRVPVFIHPTDCPHVDELALGRPHSVIEFPFDTARTITNAIYTGVFLRHSGLRLIVPHCGGPLPTMAWRIGEHTTVAIGPHDTPITPEHVADALRRLYYDTAMAASRNSLLPTLEVTSIDHLLFGTDYPAAPEATIARTIDQLTTNLAGQELRAVEHDNARGLFPRLSRPSQPG